MKYTGKDIQEHKPLNGAVRVPALPNAHAQRPERATRAPGR